MIVESIWEAFHLEPEVKKEGDVTLLRVQGLDSLSLAQWIKSKYPKLEIDYKEHLGYQFSDDDWIKIKYVVSIVYT